MEKKTIFGLDDILAILPHRPPFLFVDRVTKFTPDKLIVAERMIRSDEPWFAGHFPQKAIMPGALVLDALAQTSGLLLGFSQKKAGMAPPATPRLFFLASSHIKFVSPAYPKETLELIVDKKEEFGVLHSYLVEAIVGRKTIAKGTLMLASVEGTI